jgi:signal transduction histidine kinase
VLGCGTVHRELLLVVAFLGMGAWEILELLLFEAPRRDLFSLLAHAAQVAVVLVATLVVLKLWQEKTAREADLARLVERAVFVRDEERRRVGYDLHDGIAPLIISAQQHLDTCRDRWPEAPDPALRELGLATDAVRAAITETRRVVMAIRPAVLDSTGLTDAVRTTIDTTARTAGWRVSFEDSVGPARLPEAVEVAAFRIFQEAVENARRHARCARLSVGLHRRRDWLELAVEDDGVGFAPSAEGTGLGLSSMRERARLVGGQCVVTSAPGQGTRVRARLPWAVSAAGP